jgi:1-acyl-sn-glycerol-3-phosphate acyltransferase
MNNRYQQSKNLRLIDFVRTALFLPCFIFTLGGFHPLLLLASFGDRALFRKVLDCMNYAVLLTLRIAGTKISVSFPETLPTKGPYIIVCNHQSMFDIPIIIWYLRRYSPVFVAKKELSRGIPSISLSLRTMGSIMIDRENPAQAIAEIESLAEQSGDTGCICIFPEGTRARDGIMKRFKQTGLTRLLQKMPNAQVIPVTIQGSWELVRFKLFPVPSGIKLSCTVHPARHYQGNAPATLINDIETQIRSHL